MFQTTQFEKLRQEYQTLAKIQNSGLVLHLKLALLYANVPETFKEIKDRFAMIFPQVEDIKLTPSEQEELPLFIAGFPLLYIKEAGRWINQERISTGMKKVLMFMANMYVCADGSVVLIDEFENSLGINCIDILDELPDPHRRLQYIITSHHPYIINNISMANWKIVTRKGGVITIKTARDFDLGKSKHKGFVQLMELFDEFTAEVG